MTVGRASCAGVVTSAVQAKSAGAPGVLILDYLTAVKRHAPRCGTR
jgi:hypothetical protein